MNAGLFDMARDRRQPQAARVYQRVADPTAGAPDESDDVERVMPGVVGALAKLDDELSPPWNGRHCRQRLQLEPTDEIEQRPVVGANAGQFDTLVAKPAQKQRAGRVEAAQVP